MVLDNAVDGSAEEFVREDSLPMGDITTLNTNQFAVNSPPNSIVLSFDSLPIIFKPQDRANIADTVLKQANNASSLMRRPINMEEAQAFLENVAYATSLRKTGNIIGISCAVAWTGWSTYRIYQRDKTQIQQAWRSSATPKPSLVQLTRPFWRPWALLPLVVACTVTFVHFNVSASLVVREMRDPRLATYKQAIDADFRKRSPYSSRQQRENDSTTQPETFEQRRQRQSMQDMIRRSRGREQSDFASDDASPTASSFDESWNTPASQPSTTDSYAQSRAPSSTVSSRPATRQPTPRSSTSESTSDFYDFGDSSATASSPSPTSAQSATSSQATKSANAWERLRQEAMNNRPNK